MFSSIIKYSNVDDITKYISMPGQLKKGISRLAKEQVKDYEKCEENFTWSLSLLYAGGLIGKVKYELTKSALVMRNNGKKTNKVGVICQRKE